MSKRVLFKEADIREGGAITLKSGWGRPVEFGMYAQNFQAAARALVEELRSDRTFMHSVSTAGSFRAYPVIYLYRHALELALKGTIVAGADLLEYQGQPIDFNALFKKHSFGSLRADLERVFEATGFGWDLGIPGFRQVEDFRRLLAEFDEFDPSSTVCRYPVSRDRQDMSEPCINIVAFAEMMESLLDVLCDVPGLVEDLVDEYMDYLADAMRY